MRLWRITFTRRSDGLDDKSSEGVIVQSEFLPIVHRWAETQKEELETTNGGRYLFEVEAFVPLDLDAIGLEEMFEVGGEG